MGRLKADERMGIKGYYYKTDAIYNVESAVAFLLNIRKIDNIIVENIDLRDDLRSSEGSMSTVLDGNISEKELTEEINKRNVDLVEMYVEMFNEIIFFSINLRTWELYISLDSETKIDIEDLEERLVL